jgi:para-aminobenzoate synthetase component 1
MPELWLGLYPRIYVADHGRREAWLASRPAACEAPRAAARRREALEAWIEAACALSRRPEPRAAAEEPRGDWRETWEPSLNPGRYRRAVARILEYLRAGDAYQVNLTVRYRRTARADPRRIFASLLEVNPAPFSAMILGEGWAALSSSPELFLDLGPRGTLQTRPIKGTRARGAGAEARSAAGEEALLASEKDRAEHVMIVDLERNDVGGVARYGTVRVEPFLAVERFPGLDHLVSTVSGRMRPGLGIADALAALFPGGSVTGAPKIRAMEIIHELEPAPRGLYCGALGWIAPEGEARLNLPIRTMAWREGRLDLHVGGGIVADSDPEAEDAECRVKGEAIARAVERAEESAGPAGGREDQAARGGRPFATERLLAR